MTKYKYFNQKEKQSSFIGFQYKEELQAGLPEMISGRK